MSLHRLVENYSTLCGRCDTPDALFDLTLDAARELGFPRLALVHGLWFQRPDRQLIRIDNFGEWADLFVEREYYRDDPVLLACQRENKAFPWTDLARLVPFGPRQRLILAEASRHGLCNGFTLPVGVAGEPTGCCSFSCDMRQLPSPWRCRAAALIAAEAFHEARRLHGFPARARQLPHLSKRELECLRLIAIGKTDDVIATILSLSVKTIRSYAASLRRKFNVSSRQQLAVDALRFALISYDEAIPQP
jgi:DNA-binding CsgD family transcriptional regulator